MTDAENIYRPPSADLTRDEQAPDYFVVGTTKLVVMSICTLGIYELYWCYRNWQCIKEREQSNLMPFWRAVFAPLWVFSLARDVKERADHLGIGNSLRPMLIGILYLALSIQWRLPGLYWVISFFSFAALLPIQATDTSVSAANASGTQDHSQFTPWNYVAVVLGGLVFVLGVVGSFLPEPAA